MKVLPATFAVEKVCRLTKVRWGAKDRWSSFNCVFVLGPDGSGKNSATECLGSRTGGPLQCLAASLELCGSKEVRSEIGSMFGQAAVAKAIVVAKYAAQLLYETMGPEAAALSGLEQLHHVQSLDRVMVLWYAAASATPCEIVWPKHVPIPARVGSILRDIVVLSELERDEGTDARLHMTIADLKEACKAALKLVAQAEGTPWKVRGLDVQTCMWMDYDQLRTAFYTCLNCFLDHYR